MAENRYNVDDILREVKEKRDREQNRPCPDKGQCIQKPRSNA